MTQQKAPFGVIGNPVEHSLSPRIHTQFANQFGHSIDYQKYQLNPHELKSFIANFFATGGKGLNVTLPYKQTVIPLLDRLSEEAALSQSVNTVYLDDKHNLVGATTDGQGLLLDLELQGFQVKGKKILLIGAGGASASILAALLKAGASISLYNRTLSKAEKLQQDFATIGEVELFDPYEQQDHEISFDALVSSISQFNLELFSKIQKYINQNTYCYDLNYGQRAETFKQFALQNRCYKFSDGFGMLKGQAAIAYKIWQGVLPDISQITQYD